MQLVWTSPSTDDRYVTDRAWESATPPCCPFHPHGGCGLGPLGSYPRVWPVGARIPRFWCPVQRASISLLPEFLAARLRGSLDAVEDVVDAVETAGSVERAIEVVHPATAADAISLTSARRAIDRRLRPIRAVLRAAVTTLVELAGCSPTLADVRRRLGVDRVLVPLRRRLAPRLDAWPAPFGFRARAAA